MLNGMVADLGHTSFNGFGDEKFGANELNKITGDLVGAGVLINGNMCRVIKDDSGNIILQTGIIVFSNGAKMEITSPVTIEANAGSYIYALNDTLQGRCSIEVAESYPTEGDFVKLCRVNADGSLMDNRTVAKAKMELYTGNSSWSVLNTHAQAIYDEAHVYTQIPKIVWDRYNYIAFEIVSTTSNSSIGKINFCIFEKSKVTYKQEFLAVYYGDRYLAIKAYISETEDEVVVRTWLYEPNSDEHSKGGTTKIMLI